MLIDTHCHLIFGDLAEQAEPVMARARDAGVEHVLNVATTADEAARSLKSLARFPDVSFIAGVHPHEAARPGEEWERVAALLRGDDLEDELHKRLVAVGETGLDFHYDFAPPDAQERLFHKHLELAVERELPVVIHARSAESRVCDILRDYPSLAGRVVFHCFSGPVDAARRLLNDGHWISITGIVTFKNAAEVREVAALVPGDRLMLETDAPFLSPVPMRKVKPCEPALLVHTARKTAELRGVTFEALAEQTTVNARRFFGLTR